MNNENHIKAMLSIVFAIMAIIIAGLVRQCLVYHDELCAASDIIRIHLDYCDGFEDAVYDYIDNMDTMNYRYAETLKLEDYSHCY